jgi:multidrug efflux pump subunit AcrA (membrane-fusion protein)
MTQLSSFPKRAAAPAALLRGYWPLLAVAGLVVASAAAWFAAGMPGKTRLAGDEHPIAATQSTDGDAAARTTVTLSPARAAEAAIQTATVGRQSIRSDATVPGRLTHDAARRLAITAPVDCVVQEVLVRPGQQVSQGDRLVIVASPEVGLARDQVARAMDDLRLGQRESENADEILMNVKSLLAQLEQSPAPAAVLKQFSAKRLGIHREHVLAAYSKMLLAKAAVDDTGALATSGALSRRVIQQRQSDYEVAAAGFESQRETTLFESQQARVMAAAALGQKDRLLRVAQGRLKRLLGSLTVEEKQEKQEQTPSQSDDLSQLVVVAAQAGRIEDRVVVAQQRLTAGDEILTLADPSMLWISASIHEHQWQAASLGSGDAISVRFPALGEQTFTARVRFVGSQVSEETRSLPLIAEIENADGRLKPGMFAWVSLPLEQSREGIVVPPNAVMRHEGQAFVFVAAGEGKFRRVDVQLGCELPEFIEVVSGLSGGEQIAVSGTFLLKSELLLEHEE